MTEFIKCESVVFTFSLFSYSSETEFEDTSMYFQSPTNLRKDLKVGANRKVLSDQEDSFSNDSEGDYLFPPIFTLLLIYGSLYCECYQL